MGEIIDAVRTKRCKRHCLPLHVRGFVSREIRLLIASHNHFWPEIAIGNNRRFLLAGSPA